MLQNIYWYPIWSKFHKVKAIQIFVFINSMSINLFLELNEHLQEDKANLKWRTEQLLEDIKDQRDSLTSISDTNRNLMDQCAQLNQQVQAKLKEIETLNIEHEDELQKRNEMEESLEDTITDLQEEKDSLMKSSHKLANQHKTLLKK